MTLLYTNNLQSIKYYVRWLCFYFKRMQIMRLGQETLGETNYGQLAERSYKIGHVVGYNPPTISLAPLAKACVLFGSEFYNQS